MDRKALLCLLVVGCSPGANGFDFATAGGTSGPDDDASSGVDPEGGDAASDADGSEKYDVGAGSEGPSAGDGGGECLCGDAGLLFSYIWVANSEQGTVSKIDTQTMVEVGRYVARPDGAGNPSRTSVTIDGRAVAVANRHGGITKIWAREEDCADTNGIPGIQTSTGAGDVLAWGEDECVAWYTEFPAYTTQRPVAWTAGTLNPTTCRYEQQKLWTSGCGGGDYPGFGGPGGIGVHRLDGETGEIEASVQIEGQMCPPVGAYGGAVDAAGDFWFNRVGEGADILGVVRLADMSYELFDAPPGVYAYGMTVDAKGRPWVSNVHAGQPAARFDPTTATWAVAQAPQLGSDGGMQMDALGRMWVAAYGDGSTAVVGLDGETLEVVDKLAIPDAGIIKGISVDVDGHVWAVSHDSAFRVLPGGGDIERYDGLDGPYTYSDMTGWGLFHTECPTPEG
jgi:streptogramin lyase